MFEVFGEFDSAEELNQAAAGQKAEGDQEALFQLAKENGLDAEDAEDYLNGVVPQLATPLMAAYGKLQVEAEDLKPFGIMEDWLMCIRVQCANDERMAAAVRRKGKSLKGCIGKLLEWSFHNQHEVDKKIMKAAGVTAQKCTMGIPGMQQAKKLITEYYVG